MEQVQDPASGRNYPSQRILGIVFFNGPVDEAVEKMFRTGGFMVAPSGTCFSRLQRDNVYRDAMVSADLAIPDSGAMVLLWKLLRGENLNRISGLLYLRSLVARLRSDQSRTVLWVVPNEQARSRTLTWLTANQLDSTDANIYIAPFYGTNVEDRQLIEKIEALKPSDVIIGIGSGPQEKLGRYLRDHLSYRPAIHCIGGALGFLTGDQIAIPNWADRLYLGWAFRLVSQPLVFIPRLARAFELPGLILKYGGNLPPFERESR